MMADENDRLPDEELISQMSCVLLHMLSWRVRAELTWADRTFALAGMDTTSNAVSRILHILSDKPDYQQKLRDEILAARSLHGDDIPYDDLMQLPFLDAVCRETLRLYVCASIPRYLANSFPRVLDTPQSGSPCAGESASCPLRKRLSLHIGGRAVKDTVMPLSTPIRSTDGKLLTEVHVPKGTAVLLNLIASNRNKDLWGADAEEWRPERWLGELPREVEDAPIPGIYSHL